MAIHTMYFKARDWERNRSCPNSIGERCFISGPFGRLEEVCKVGSQTNSRSEIISKPMMLESGSIYHFCFWLKDMERQEDTTARFQVIFDGKIEQAYQYQLDPGYIEPQKYFHGWKQYDITFETHNTGITQLKYIVSNGCIMLMAANNLDEYHNLHTGKEQEEQPLLGTEMEATELYQQILRKLESGCVKQQIVDDIVEELVERVKESIDVDALIQEFTASIDTVKLKEEIRKCIRAKLIKDL